MRIVKGYCKSKKLTGIDDPQSLELEYNLSITLFSNKFFFFYHNISAVVREKFDIIEYEHIQ